MEGSNDKRLVPALLAQSESKDAAIEKARFLMSAPLFALGASSRRNTLPPIITSFNSFTPKLLRQNPSNPLNPWS
jgi:hypothetical protein